MKDEKSYLESIQYKGRQLNVYVCRLCHKPFANGSLIQQLGKVWLVEPHFCCAYCLLKDTTLWTQEVPKSWGKDWEDEERYVRQHLQLRIPEMVPAVIQLTPDATAPDPSRTDYYGPIFKP